MKRFVHTLSGTLVFSSMDGTSIRSPDYQASEKKTLSSTPRAFDAGTREVELDNLGMSRWYARRVHLETSLTRA